jgi:hypothetical protein
MATINSLLMLYILAIAALISLISCRPQQQSLLHPDVLPQPLDVPGKNPLVFCSGPESYILKIAYVDMIPNPPEA